MTGVAELSLEQDGISVNADQVDDRLVISFIGVAELNVHDRLAALLGTVHQRAADTAAAEVVIDFSQLEFMSATCLRSFISWINQLQQLPMEKQYRIRFVSNPDMPWQRRSFHALKCFATELISIEGTT